MQFPLLIRITVLLTVNEYLIGIHTMNSTRIKLTPLVLVKMYIRYALKDSWDSCNVEDRETCSAKTVKGV